MAVKVGSARVDENGKAHAGKAGDQTGKEVSTQNWYLHKKGWRCVRAKDPEIAERMASAMQAACDNPHIGYDQWQRDTLRKQAEAGEPRFWPGTDNVTEDTETDCSALVRVCAAYAVGRDVIGEVIGKTRYSTANQVRFMVATGLFEELKDDKYTTRSDYLKRGDVLVTKTQGHTVIVLSDGPKAGAVETVKEEYPELRRGCTGKDVARMQELLLVWDATCLPVYGADGDFGKESQRALLRFQFDAGLTTDGVCDRGVWEKLMSIEKIDRTLRVTGSKVNLRAGAGVWNEKIGSTEKNDTLVYTEVSDIDGTSWYHTDKGWICGLYVEVVK